MFVREIGVASVGETSSVHLNPTGLTVVSGNSATGKSALLLILDWVLAGRKSRIPEGIILQKVEWFFVRLSSGQRDLLVARKSPKSKDKSVYLRRLEFEEDTPYPEDLQDKFSADLAKNGISDFFGIGLKVVPQSDKTLAAPFCPSVRMILPLSILNVNAKGQSANSFLGGPSNPNAHANVRRLSVDLVLQAEGETSNLEQQIQKLKRGIKQVRYDLKDLQYYQGSQDFRARQLAFRAVQVGLSRHSVEELKEWPLENVLAFLKEIQNVDHGLSELGGSAGFGIEGDLLEAEWEVEEILAVKKAVESQIQHAREDEVQFRVATEFLKFALEGESGQSGSESDFADRNEFRSLLRRELVTASREFVSRRSYLVAFNSHLETRLEAAKLKRDELAQALKKSPPAQDALSSLVQRSQVFGAIGHEIELGGTLGERLERLEIYEANLAELEQRLAECKEQRQDRITAINNQIAKDVGLIAQWCELEHSNLGITFDLEADSLIFQDKEDFNLSAVGSSFNVETYRLAVFMARMAAFASRQLSVLHSVFADQVFSWGNYSETGEISEQDRTALIKVLNAVRRYLDLAERRGGGFQLIVLDHFLGDNNLVTDEELSVRWVGDVGLVPESWPDRF